MLKDAVTAERFAAAHEIDVVARVAAPADGSHADEASSAMRTAPPPWLLAAIALFSVYTIWGSTYLAIRYVVEVLPPFSMAGARFIVSGAILFGLARLRGGEPITRVQWRSAAIVGALLLLGGNGLVCWAEKYVSSGVAAVTVATVPMWFVLLEWMVFRGGAPRIPTVLGIVAGLVGVVILFNPFAAVAKDGVNFGGALALNAACVSWAFGSLWSRRAALPKSAILATGMEMLCGGAALLIVGLLLGEAALLKWEHFTLRSVGAFFYLLTFGSLIGFTAYVWLLKNVPPTVVATYAFVNPAVAVFLGWFVGETELTARTGIAVGVILLGVVIITVSPKGKK